MESNHAEAVATSPAPDGAGAGRWERRLLWLGGTLLAAGAIAWLAVQFQSAGFAPVLLMPLGVGIALALVIEGLGSLVGLRPSRAWLVVAIVGGLLLVGAQSWFGYLTYCRAFAEQEQKHPQLSLFRGGEGAAAGGEQALGPARFGHYMAGRLTHAPGWLLWTVDAALTLAGTVGWTAWRLRMHSAETRSGKSTGQSGTLSNPPLPG